MVKNPAEAATVMPINLPAETGPPALPLTTNMTASSLTSGGNSCLDEQIERLKRCEYLREGEVKALCLRAREILVDESNVQRVDAPVTVSSRTICSEMTIHSESVGKETILLSCQRIIIIAIASFLTLFLLSLTFLRAIPWQP